MYRLFILPILISLLCFGLNAQVYVDDLDQKSFREVQIEMESLLLDQQIPDRARQYKHFKRWELANEGHIDVDGKPFNYASKTYAEYLKLEREFLQSDKPARITNGHWSQVTPTQFTPGHPNNGRINVIAVHPNNEDIVYVGAAIGGLWKSVDAGNTWVNLTDGLPVIGISGIAIHPVQTNTIYILTGDGDGRHIPSIGILKSADGGNTWQPTGLMWGEDQLNYGYKILMHPSNPDIMYAPTKFGLYRTDDGWDTNTLFMSTESMRDVEFKPDNPDTLYASSWRYVYLGKNNGTTWIPISTTDSILPFTNSMSRVAIAVSPHDPNGVYALHAYNVPGGGNGYQGLYRSFDAADTWDEVTDTLNLVGDGNYNQVTWDLEIVADPNNFDRVIVAGILTYESQNTGIGGSWSPLVSPGAVHSDVHHIVFTPSHMYMATDGGMTRSDDNGQSWINISEGLDIGQYYDIDVKSGQHIIGGTQDNGTIKWQVGDVVGDRTISADGFECFFHPTDPNIMYGSTQEIRFKSNNAGSNWFSVQPPGHGDVWDASWIMHPTNPDTLYAAWKDLSRTYDGGSSWQSLSTGFTGDKTIRSMAQGVSNPNKLFVSDRLSLRRTTSLHSANPNWIDVSSGLPIDTIALGGLAVDPANSDRVWATFLGYEEGMKVFFSSDGGFSWTNVSGSLPNVPVYCIVYQQGSNDGLYIGTNLGVFYHNASMSDWIYFSNGLPTTRIEDLHIEDNTIYAGTFGRSIWKSQVYTNCPATMVLTPANDPSDQISTGMQYYEASGSIESTRTIQGGIGTNVNYRAGDFVRLDPGFEVKSYNQFEAKTGGCTQQ